MTFGYRDTYEEGDGAVKVREEDVLGIGVLEVRHVE